MKNKSTKGFTLIELLVVIAIIGILASVVVASLNSARSKGADASIKANLANARAQAEIFYDENGVNGYNNVCTASNGIGNMVAAAARAYATGATVTTPIATAQPANGHVCHATVAGWAASVKLKGTGYYCVDSTGVAKEHTTVIAANGIACPAS